MRPYNVSQGARNGRVRVDERVGVPLRPDPSRVTRRACYKGHANSPDSLQGPVQGKRMPDRSLLNRTRRSRGCCRQARTSGTGQSVQSASPVPRTAFLYRSGVVPDRADESIRPLRRLPSLVRDQSVPRVRPMPPRVCRLVLALNIPSHVVALLHKVRRVRSYSLDKRVLPYLMRRVRVLVSRHHSHD